MENRREFLKKAGLLSGGAAMINMLPPVIQKAMAINPAPGSTFYDAEHIVFLMQENRAFDHQLGMLQGVRGFNDPRAINLPDKNKVWLQTDEHGNTYGPFHLDRKQTKIAWMGSLPHNWANQTDAMNMGKYDNWLKVKKSGNKDYRNMPLTLGYGDRSDFPFYYSLADAFTVCDQNFCSSITGTHSNRHYWMTGTVREKNTPDGLAHLWNITQYNYPELKWKTYPEQLEENGISWKVYQNELTMAYPLKGQKEALLGNFGTNVLEYFDQYNVRLHEGGLAGLQDGKEDLQKQIAELEQRTGDPRASQKAIAARRLLASVEAAQQKYTQEKFDSLPEQSKNIHTKAFSINSADPDFHDLETLQYNDNGTERSLNAPKGDVFHQFREDVKNDKLPTVSWLMPPGNFSDHPGEPWFGPWYVSEAMEILLENPEVWKKTIFILTYDENDGFFDHVPPFIVPDPYKNDAGKVSKDIDAKLDFVLRNQQHNPSEDPKNIREASMGLGYRVPMIICSPWTRGGFVNSEVFDHTSSLQFIENFIEKKTGKKIAGENITQWRRTICGDLTSAFRPYNGEKIEKPVFLDKDKFMEDIHQAQFKQVPDNFKKLNSDEIAKINTDHRNSPDFPQQEKGIRPACALPYELYTDGQFNKAKNAYELTFKAGNNVFGKKAAGSAFKVYAMNPFKGETLRAWDYSASAGDTLQDEWTLNDFENGNYHLRVYGPNGFYRELMGNGNNPLITVSCDYERRAFKLTGNVIVKVTNHDSQPHTVLLTDNSYGTTEQTKTVAQGGSIIFSQNLEKSFNWYDVSLKVNGHNDFEERFAGRVETGSVTKTDPLMGGVV
ncbi:phospholipase C, phosphocholine-specific [Mucilaginibacter sp. dw_454]|uniref:phosphocholine-specific phospholipase C n=1 Tax=Mucilaginibacter sp. dw_454 TaxID=2720079 RepID=UPI001BD2AFF1|nr:phospholipase C, phosphocholine-specific [Mucilaginibacter sp. dw_454]